MKSCILICDSGEFIPEERVYKLGRSLNSIVIPTVPHIYELFLFVKLFNLSPDIQYNIRTVIYDDQGNVFSETDNRVVYNQRQESQVPGVDTSLRINTPICRPGTYTAKLFVDDTLSAECPITVFVEG